MPWRACWYRVPSRRTSLHRSGSFRLSRRRIGWKRGRRQSRPSIENKTGEAAMRVLCGALAALLLLFAAVQYNDADALFWAGLYWIGVLWCGLGAFWPAVLGRTPAQLLLLATVGLVAATVIVYWPDAERWWA